MIGLPYNDYECLGAISQILATLVEERDPVLLELAAKYPTTERLIERDETLTVEGIESGPYVIRASGLVGAVQCWAAADVLTVPAGASLVKSIQLAPSRGAGC
jgi:hypothetical protein